MTQEIVLAGEPTSKDAAALQIVKLIDDLDQMILALQEMVPALKPWQRQLLSLLCQADRQMQVLRMSEVMEKPDEAIGEAAIQLGRTCRQIRLAMQGSRADGVVRSAAMSLAQFGDALSSLMVQETRTSHPKQDTAEKKRIAGGLV